MAGDTLSLHEFVALRGDALVRFAYVLTGADQHAAEDLVQSALIKVMRRWNGIAAGGHPEAYLRRVIVTTFVSGRRRRSSSELITAEPPEHADADAFAQADAEDAAWRIIARLPRRQRAVLALRYLYDWTDEQIAAACDCRPSTVRSQASRALASLRESLGPSWMITVGEDDGA